jgi:hypothetical protein
MPESGARHWPTIWSRERRRTWLNLRDGWPLSVLYLGFPLWWVLGNGSLKSDDLQMPHWALSASTGGCLPARG